MSIIYYRIKTALADQIDNSPMLLPSLQLLHRQVRQLGPAKPTAETECQDGSTAFAPKGLTVGAVQQGSRLLAVSQLRLLRPVSIPVPRATARCRLTIFPKRDHNAGRFRLPLAVV
jgi:hypothetical protein